MAYLFVIALVAMATALLAIIGLNKFVSWLIGTSEDTFERIRERREQENRG